MPERATPQQGTELNPWSECAECYGYGYNPPYGTPATNSYDAQPPATQQATQVVGSTEGWPEGLDYFPDFVMNHNWFVMDDTRGTGRLGSYDFPLLQCTQWPHNAHQTDSDPLFSVPPSFGKPYPGTRPSWEAGLSAWRPSDPAGIYTQASADTLHYEPSRLDASHHAQEHGKPFDTLSGKGHSGGFRIEEDTRRSSIDLGLTTQDCGLTSEGARPIEASNKCVMCHTAKVSCVFEAGQTRCTTCTKRRRKCTAFGESLPAEKDTRGSSKGRGSRKQGVECKKRERSRRACQTCRSAKGKCVVEGDHTSCLTCKRKQITCELDDGKLKLGGFFKVTFELAPGTNSLPPSGATPGELTIWQYLQKLRGDPLPRIHSPYGAYQGSTHEFATDKQ